MKRLLTIFFLLTLLIVPAFAQSVTYTPPTGKAIYTIEMSGDSPVSVTFNLQRQDGSVTSGSWSYEPYTLLGFYDATKVTITLDGVTDSQTFITPAKMHINLYPSRNLTELAETRLIMGASQTNMLNDISVEKDGITSPIVGFSFNADSEITYSVTEDELQTVSENLHALTPGGILNIISSTLSGAIAFVEELWYWIQYFFIDNLAMIVALFLAVPMAFAAKNSRGNPEKFLRQYFKTLRGFFEFVLSLWRMLLESIGTIRGWFRV